jgi:hypothetical protein
LKTAAVTATAGAASAAAIAAATTWLATATAGLATSTETATTRAAPSAAAGLTTAAVAAKTARLAKTALAKAAGGTTKPAPARLTEAALAAVAALALVGIDLLALLTLLTLAAAWLLLLIVHDIAGLAAPAGQRCRVVRQDARNGTACSNCRSQAREHRIGADLPQLDHANDSIRDHIFQIDHLHEVFNVFKQMIRRGDDQ